MFKRMDYKWEKRNISSIFNSSNRTIRKRNGKRNRIKKRKIIKKENERKK